MARTGRAGLAQKGRQYILSSASANRRFAPTIVGTVLTIVGVTIFVNLGLWQLRRAEQKEALQTAYERGQDSTVIATSENIATLPRYQRVQMHGRYRGDRQILLDNMPSAHGRPGFRVLTLFELADGRHVLVDRGWIPMGDRRTDLPPLDVNEEPREIVGRLDELPQPGLRLDQAPQDASDAWPRVMNFPERETIEAALGLALAPYVVLLDPSEPHVFERAWHPVTRVGPERHIGYAVQWFAFAIVAVIIYASLSVRRARRPEAVD